MDEEVLMIQMLIIEDSLQHQMAARVQFPEATVVNYDEAYKILERARPGEIGAILTDLHFKVERDRNIPAAPWSYDSNYNAIGTELPFGLAFVLKGVELQTPVVLYSDRDHHSDLVTGLLDMLGRNGRYPWRKDGEKDPIADPKFLLLRDGGCHMAEDMHWDGGKIVPEPMPEAPSFEDREAWTAHWKKRVKDWRVAHGELARTFGKSA